GVIPPPRVAQLGRILRRMFPGATEAGLEHAWCGVLGVPRDWCATVTLDPQTGLGWAGGYTGHGGAASNLAGRTRADLVRRVPSPLTTLPWGGHRPLRPPAGGGPGAAAGGRGAGRRGGGAGPVRPLRAGGRAGVSPPYPAHVRAGQDGRPDLGDPPLGGPARMLRVDEVRVA